MSLGSHLPKEFFSPPIKKKIHKYLQIYGFFVLVWVFLLIIPPSGRFEGNKCSICLEM